MYVVQQLLFPEFWENRCISAGFFVPVSIFWYSSILCSKQSRHVEEPCAFSFFFPLFIVFFWTFPMPFDTVSLCHSPEEIFKLLSCAIKVKYSTLLQHYFLQCISLYKLSFVIFILQSTQITTSFQQTLNYISWIPEQPLT